MRVSKAVWNIQTVLYSSLALWTENLQLDQEGEDSQRWWWMLTPKNEISINGERQGLIHLLVEVKKKDFT